MWYICLGVLLFVAASFIRRVKADEVAIRNWFGQLEEKVLSPGLHIMPRFFGIGLVRFPTKMFKLDYESGAEKFFSKDFQVLTAEGTFFVQFPYKHAECLIAMIKAGVPMEEDELKKYCEDVFEPMIRRALKTIDYKDVLGGDVDQVDVDEQVCRVVNMLLQNPEGVLFKAGIFGKDVTNTNPGNGHAYLELEQVLPTDAVQEKLESVATAKLDAEAAKSLAEADYTRLYGPVEIAKSKGLNEASAIELRSQELAGGNFTKSKDEKVIDIRSGGQQFNPNFAGIIGTAEVVADAVARALGKSGGGGGRGGQQRSGRGGQRDNRGGDRGNQRGDRNHEFDAKQEAELEQQAEVYHSQYGSWPSWDPKGRR